MASKKPRCKSQGCRKAAGADSIFCQLHEQAAHPEDALMKCTREEALRFAALDAEYRLKLQVVQTLEVQGDNARMQYEAICRKRAEEKTSAMREAERFRGEYEALVRQIAQAHNLDPRKMTIDPETCVVRDLRDANPG